MTRKRHSSMACEQPVGAGRLDAAIAACLPVRQANLKELGYAR